MYCNLPDISTQNLDYLQYLDKFNSFFYIPEANKINKAYGQYVTALWEYLSDFFHRIQPLVNVDEYVQGWNNEFTEKWNKGELIGWKPPRKPTTAQPPAPTPLRLGMFNSPEELEALGLDRLKEGLEALGLKCGGTLSQRAQRLWSVRGKKQEDIPANLKVKKHTETNGVEKESTNGSSFVFLGTGDDGRRQVCFLLSYIISPVDCLD